MEHQTSADAWSMRRSSHRPSNSAILKIVWRASQTSMTLRAVQFVIFSSQIKLWMGVTRCCYQPTQLSTNITLIMRMNVAKVKRTLQKTIIVNKDFILEYPHQFLWSHFNILSEVLSFPTLNYWIDKMKPPFLFALWHDTNWTKRVIDMIHWVWKKGLFLHRTFSTLTS